MDEKNRLQEAKIPGKGQGLISCSKFSAGYPVISAAPLLYTPLRIFSKLSTLASLSAASAASDHSLRKVCANAPQCFSCLKSLERPAYCGGCDFVAYCNRFCQANCWKKHRKICPYLKVIKDKSPTPSFFLALEVFIFGTELSGFCGSYEDLSCSLSEEMGGLREAEAAAMLVTSCVCATLSPNGIRRILMNNATAPSSPFSAVHESSGLPFNFFLQYISEKVSEAGRNSKKNQDGSMSLVTETKLNSRFPIKEAVNGIPLNYLTGGELIDRKKIDPNLQEDTELCLDYVEELYKVFLQIIVKISRNCFVITDDRLRFTSSSDIGIALYPQNVAKLNHSCLPNCIYTFGAKDFSIRITALQEIKKGEEICIAYDDVASPTKERRERLKKSHGFICCCLLCSAVDYKAYHSLIAAEYSNPDGQAQSAGDLEKQNTRSASNRRYCNSTLNSKDGIHLEALLDRFEEFQKQGLMANSDLLRYLFLGKDTFKKVVGLICSFEACLQGLLCSACSCIEKSSLAKKAGDLRALHALGSVRVESFSFADWNPTQIDTADTSLILLKGGREKDIAESSQSVEYDVQTPALCSRYEKSLKASQAGKTVSSFVKDDIQKAVGNKGEDNAVGDMSRSFFFEPSTCCSLCHEEIPMSEMKKIDEKLSKLKVIMNESNIRAVSMNAALATLAALIRNVHPLNLKVQEISLCLLNKFTELLNASNKPLTSKGGSEGQKGLGQEDSMFSAPAGISRENKVNRKLRSDNVLHIIRSISNFYMSYYGSVSKQLCLHELDSARLLDSINEPKHASAMHDSSFRLMRIIYGADHHFVKDALL